MFYLQEKCHFAKDYPNKREKSIRLLEHLQATTEYSPEKDELEFYFSEQDEPNDETVFALQQSSDDSDSDQSQAIFHQQLLSLDTTVPIPSNLFLEYKEVSRESLKLSQLPPKHINYIENIYMLYTSLHGSRILHGVGHVEAWAMTFSPTYSGDVLVNSLWKALILSWNCHKSFTASQLVSLSGSPFHLTKYSWHGGKLFFRTTWSAKMVSTSLSYTLVLPSGGRLDSPLFESSVSPWYGFKELTWKTGWSFRQEGNSSLYDTLPTVVFLDEALVQRTCRLVLGRKDLD